MTCMLCGGLLAGSRALTAQPYRLVIDGPSHILSTNPFILLAGWFSGEFEQRINSSASVLAALSYYDFDDQQSTSAEAKMRLYPVEHALGGFNMGASIGVSSLRYRPNSGYDCIADTHIPTCGDNVITRHVTTPTFGIEVGNQWLLGAHRRTAVTLGIGAKRYLSSKKEMPGKDRLTGTWRFGIGYGF